MARSISVSQSTLRDIIGSKQSKPSFDTLKAIVECTTIEVSASWLIRGKPFSLEENLEGVCFDAKNELTNGINEPEVEYKIRNKIETRPRIPYTAAAGVLSNVLDGIVCEQCEQMPVIKILPDYDFTIILKGDSMEPKYEGGDEVACKRIDNTSFIQWGKTHVLNTSQGIIVKRIYDDGGKIKCVSYNPEFSPFSIDRGEIYSISLVVGLIRI